MPRARKLPARTIEEVLAAHPSLRQSLLSSWDDCHLSTLFQLQDPGDWSNAAQARGQMFHRFAAEALRTMRRQGERSIPVAEALEILEECLRQRDVPPGDRVALPRRELPALRMSVIKFAADNEFNVDAIVDVERRLEAEIEYVAPDGSSRSRKLSGQLDVLLARPPDGAVIIDWKDTWGVPPEAPEGDAGAFDPDHISYHGYFQQRFYGWLVMRNFPAIAWVTLREFYPRRGAVRKATVTRADVADLERDLATLAGTLDDALMAGEKAAGFWKPSPGKHCAYCLRPGRCPIEREARGEGAITSPEIARRYAAEREVAQRVYKHRTTALKAWVDAHGDVPVKSAKGRLVVGWRANKTGKGRSFVTYVPETSDRGRRPEDLNLEEALKASAAEAEAAKADRKDAA